MYIYLYEHDIVCFHIFSAFHSYKFTRNQ